MYLFPPPPPRFFVLVPYIFVLLAILYTYPYQLCACTGVALDLAKGCYPSWAWHLIDLLSSIIRYAATCPLYEFAADAIFSYESAHALKRHCT